jgi:uncharacterized membrane protein
MNRPAPRARDRRKAPEAKPTRALDAWVADTLALGIVVSVTVAVAADADGIGRTLLTLAFSAFVPGRAIVAHWPAAQERGPWALSVVLSIATITLLSTLAVWLHLWDPITEFAVLAVGSVVAILAAMRQRMPGPGRARPDVDRNR